MIAPFVRPPAIRARLAERFIFNFRMPPDAMRSFLPVSWLAPQVVEGYAIASFCVLDLQNITIAPFSPFAGLTSVSSAPRYAVLDVERNAEPAVFVSERTTSSPLGSRITSLGFSAPHPYAGALIAHAGDDYGVSVGSARGAAPFSALMSASPDASSGVFRDTAAFAAFVASAVRSYGATRFVDRLSVVDLIKDDTRYEALAVREIAGPLIDHWRDAGAVLDSAFRTTGGRYEWISRGLRAMDDRRT